MPYIVTTKRHHVWQDMPSDTNPSGVAEATETSRRAVATLDEARKHIDAVAIATQGYMAWDEPNMGPLTESGGTVGPLPDGTLIEVEQVEWLDLARQTDVGNGQLKELKPRILDAFNAQEATR